MKLRLDPIEEVDGVVLLRAAGPLAPGAAGRVVRYPTPRGALLRVGGAAAGAFDREHGAVELAAEAAGELTLEVERRSLPSTGLPSGDGPAWRRILARASAEPARTLELDAGAAPERPARAGQTVHRVPSIAAARTALAGHSHLDVAWLWTYEEAARKAVRTFATAVRQLEARPGYVFAQSQPQLWAWVAERDPALFGRVLELARTGRFDASGAAMWVEPDCMLPSGESLLRQLAFGMRAAHAWSGAMPSVAWLPDSFGFAATLPTLLAHAGIGSFATTKLGWNDTTRFPYARFLWEGPDGSCVHAAQIASIQGDLDPVRVARARARGDLLLVGWGDGGGGARDSALDAAPATGRWTTLAAWFARVATEAATLPVWRGELYLETHRGTATTHHDVKARHAALERGLRDCEEQLAWAYALRATPFFLDEARGQLARAWELVLRAQTHDVLPGTCTAEAYVEAFADFDEADALVAHVASSARSVLPSATRITPPQPCEPRAVRGGWILESPHLRAKVARDGTVRELAVPGGPNLVARANRLALYADRPRAWDAWNVDRGYRRRARRVRVTGAEAVDGGVEIRYAFGRSLAACRITLDAGEPFLRIEYAVDWRERHRLLRVESALGFAASSARFGAPHGSVERTPRPRTPAERAKFEAPGQRFGRADAGRAGVALLVRDTYGWSVDTRRGRTELGHSLLRAPVWPDPGADRGEAAFAFALAPCGGLGTGELEALHERFAREPWVPLAVSSDPRVLVVATKLADDGDGIVVRARECDGATVDVRLACGPRTLGVTCVDALERPVPGEAALEDGAIVARFGPHALRSFRVRVR